LANPIIPQFAAQRPEAVHANVVQLGPRTSFWGTVAPSLLQGAQTLRTMIEGNPEVEYQNRALDAKMADEWEKTYATSDNPELKAQMANERAAQLEREGRAEEAAALRARNHGLMNTKEAMNRDTYGALKNYQNTAAAYVGGQKREGAAPGIPQSPQVQENAPEHSFTPETPPDAGYGATATAGAGVQRSLPDSHQHKDTPHQLVGDLNQDAPEHPFLAQVSQTLKDQGMDVPVHMLHANGQNGVVASIQAAADGRMPWNPVAFFPPPVPKTPEEAQQVQAAVGVGQQAAPVLADVVRSASNLRVVAAVQQGREPDPTDLFGMTVNDAMANQVVNQAMYKAGVTSSQWDPVKLAGLAQLMADPENASVLVANDEYGFYQSIQDSYLRSSPAEQGVVNGVATKLGGDINTRRALQTKVELAKAAMLQKQAHEQMMLNHYNREDQIKLLELQQRGQIADQNASFKQAELGLKREDLNLRERTGQSTIDRNAAITAKEQEAGREKSIKEYLAAHGLTESTDDEIKRSERTMKAYDTPLARERSYVAKLENGLARYRAGDKKGLAEALAEMKAKKGDAGPAQARPGWEVEAQNRLQAEITERHAHIKDLQSKFDTSSQENTKLSELARAGAPSPGTYVRQYFNMDKKAQPPSDDFVRALKGLYRNEGNEFNSKEYTGDETADLKTYVGKWGAAWGKKSPAEQQILQDAFRQYHRIYRGK